MKIVIYTQRVEVIESYHERRDCADQNIPRFLEACGYIPVPVPNVISDLTQYVDLLQPVGIVLTGGNSLVEYGGQAPERDETDERLICIALERNIPIYGFCRGMQSILHHFDYRLEDITGHVAVRHQVAGCWGDMEVNSYHNQACKNVNAPLEVMEMTSDGVIEAIASKQYKLMATMWHPEREQPFREEDIYRVQQLFG